MHRLLVIAALALSLTTPFRAHAQSADKPASDLPANATLLDPDIVWDVANAQGSAVSPDGKQFAYISRGGIWVCDIAAGPSKKLADVPNTITEILARPENKTQRDIEASMPQIPNHDHYPFTGPVYLDQRTSSALPGPPIKTASSTRCASE